MENFNRYRLAIPMYNRKNMFVDIPMINLPGISVNSVKYRGEESLPFVLNAFEWADTTMDATLSLLAHYSNAEEKRYMENGRDKVTVLVISPFCETSYPKWLLDKFQL